MKLLYDVHEYQGKKYKDFYLLLDNGKYIKIKNVFPNDYAILGAIAYKKEI